MAVITDYTNRITDQYRASPKFNAMVGALCQPLVDSGTLLETLPSYFSLSTAVGAQLDTIGAWVGAPRYLKFSLAPYTFTWFDQIANGWNGGFWAKRDADGNVIANWIPDYYYRFLIRAKIDQNIFRGGLVQCQTLLRQLLEDDALLIADNQNMSFSVLVADVADPILVLLISNSYFDLRPFGVRVIWVVGNIAFAWDNNMTLRKGWDQSAKWFA